MGFVSVSDIQVLLSLIWVEEWRGAAVTWPDPCRHACDTFYACAAGCAPATLSAHTRGPDRGNAGHGGGHMVNRSPDKGSIECPTENICLTPPAAVCSLLCRAHRTVRSEIWWTSASSSCNWNYGATTATLFLREKTYRDEYRSYDSRNCCSENWTFFSTAQLRRSYCFHLFQFFIVALGTLCHQLFTS